jgi:hypothetical protein
VEWPTYGYRAASSGPPVLHAEWPRRRGCHIFTEDFFA